MNHTRHFWNIASGAVFISLIILIFQPGSRSFGDSLGMALGNFASAPEEVSEAAEGPNRVMTRIAYPASIVDTGMIDVGATLSQKQLRQLEPVPALISRQYSSEDGKCYFRFYEGRVVIIQRRTNRVLDIEKSQVLFEL